MNFLSFESCRVFFGEIVYASREAANRAIAGGAVAFERRSRPIPLRASVRIV
jgi:hypothetical protein